MPRIIGVIPARYKSSRFPGKPLADILGKPMIWWVYQNVQHVQEFSSIYIATDDERIKQTCEELNLNFIMTSSSHQTGTDRIAEVAKKINADYYVNIQGDEPLISPETIALSLEPIFKNENFDVVNLMTEIKDNSDVINSTVPKVAVNIRNEAIFMSRSAIPYPKGKRSKFYKQVCVYVFKKSALERFAELDRGPLEQAEDIELLRFIENRMIVKIKEVFESTVAVDTPADLEIVKKILSEKGLK